MYTTINIVMGGCVTSLFTKDRRQASGILNTYQRYAFDRIRRLWNNMATGDTVREGLLAYLDSIVDKFENILLNEKIEKELTEHNTGAQQSVT